MRFSAALQDPVVVRGVIVPVLSTAAVALAEAWFVRRQHTDDPLLQVYEAKLRVLDEGRGSGSGDGVAGRGSTRSAGEEFGGTFASASQAAGGGAGDRAGPAHAPAPPPSPKSEGAGESPRDAACLPCTRAHLLAASEILNEAARMAPRMGADHKEIRRRIKRAAGELLVLERFDLEPRQIEQLTPEQKAAVEEVYPHISRLRQELVSGAESPEAIRKAAAEAERLYEVVEERTRGKAAASVS